MDTVEHGKHFDSQRKVMAPRVSIWIRLSPIYILRVFRDTYVRGCVTFGNSSKVSAIAHGVPFQISSNENSLSRSSSQCVRDNVNSARELLELSVKFSRQVSEQESVQSGRKHLTAMTTGTNGEETASVKEFFSLIGCAWFAELPSSFAGLRISRFCENCSKQQKGVSHLLHTEQLAIDSSFLSLFSRQILRLHRILLLGRGLTLADLQGYASASPSPGGSPLRLSDRVSKLKLTDIQGHSSPLRACPSFDSVPETEQYTDPRLSNGNQLKMQDLFQTAALHPTEFLQSSSRRVASPDSSYQPQTITRASSERLRPLPRASSRRPERFASMPHLDRNASRSAVAPFDGYIRPHSKKSANKPNPYREYDTRLSSTPLSV